MPPGPGPVDAAEFAAALRQYAAGVCLLTVQDGIDDVGTTVTSVMSVSARPPLVAVGLSAGGYPAEVLGEVGRCALTVLAAEHAIVASRFSSAGRPSARHLLESVPWTRAPVSGGIVLGGGLAALDCRVDRLVEAGDHVLALLEVDAVPVLNPGGRPLVRLRGRYVDESGAAAGRG
jgi:flavin reductase (DIM6/NTAB) family NADH-FMN oxidoreductase RutF